jgi:hypothetical protein
MTSFDGNNSLNSRDMFFERNKYIADILTLLDGVDESTLEIREIKDFLFAEMVLLGKINTTGKAIVPSPGLLVPFFNDPTGRNVTYKFVAEAFSAMQVRFEKALRMGQIQSGLETLSELIVEKSYVDLDTQYAVFLEKTRKLFFTGIEETERGRRIYTLEDFINVLFDYFEMNANGLPFTKTQFIKSRYVSQLCSGLMIEIYKGDYGDDSVKEEKFYKNPNFEFYKELAYANGFFVDKNIPWRLVVDVNSPQMRKFIERQIVLEEKTDVEILEELFDVVFISEFDNFMSNVVNWWNIFVNRNPAVRVGRSNCNNNQFFERKSAVVSDLSIPNMIERYVHLRIFETGVPFDTPEVKKVLKRAKALFEYGDEEQFLSYLNNKFSGTAHIDGSLFSQVVKLEADQLTGHDTSDIIKSRDRSVISDLFDVF